MPTIPAENGFSEIIIRDNAHVLTNPTASEVVDLIKNSPEDVIVMGQAPVITEPLEPRFDYRRTIASIDTRLTVDLSSRNDGVCWSFRPGSNKDYLHLIGIAGIQENQSNSSSGINIRVTARPDRGVNNILVEDCYFRGMDAPMQFVDDYARGTGSNDNGRITVKVRRNILLDAIGTDSHAVHLYLEGTRTGTIVENNMFHKAGWVDDRNAPSLRPDDDPSNPESNKREHCVYAQSINQKIDLIDNFFGEPAANAYQLRAGGDSIGNILWRAPVGGWHARRDGQKIIRNVIIDQVDIADPNADPADGRGHGIWTSWSNDVLLRENIAARKHGWMIHKEAFNIEGGTAIRNHIYDWGPDASKYLLGANSNSYGNVVSVEAPNLPVVTDSMVGQWRKRARGEWDTNKSHIAYRNKVQDMVFLSKD